MSELKQQLATEQVDFVIGPLLREQVDAISQQTDWTIPTLFLNGKTDLVQQSADKFYFSLSVEDEAHQMAMLRRAPLALSPLAAVLEVLIWMPHRSVSASSHAFITGAGGQSVLLYLGKSH